MSIKDIFPIDKWDFDSESILTDLPKDEREMLLAHQSEQTYKKAEIIFKEGAHAYGIFYILSGKVKKFKVDKDGREQIIYVANTGELLGYHAVLSLSRHTDNAMALEESQIVFIPAEDFLKVIQRSNFLSRRLLSNLSHEFAVMSNALTLFAQRPVRERLALQLILLREKYKENFQPGMPVEIRMSRKDLASLVGTARENVVRVLSEFKAGKILETKARNIVVLDVKKLIAIVDSR